MCHISDEWFKCMMNQEEGSIKKWWAYAIVMMMSKNAPKKWLNYIDADVDFIK